MMIKNSTNSNETVFPEALLQSLDISSDNFLSDNSEKDEMGAAGAGAGDRMEAPDRRYSTGRHRRDERRPRAGGLCRRGRHGGGAFSGKDSTKVDRSAAYMARHVAKNIVAAKLAKRCEVQLAYAIGVADPVSVHVDTQGTGTIDDAAICEIVKQTFPLSTQGIIKYLELQRPIFRKTAEGGHFGRNDPDFTWENTDISAKIAEMAAAAAIAGHFVDLNA